MNGCLNCLRLAGRQKRGNNEVQAGEQVPFLFHDVADRGQVYSHILFHVVADRGQVYIHILFHVVADRRQVYNPFLFQVVADRRQVYMPFLFHVVANRGQVCIPFLFHVVADKETGVHVFLVPRCCGQGDRCTFPSCSRLLRTGDRRIFPANCWPSFPARFKCMEYILDKTFSRISAQLCTLPVLRSHTHTCACTHTHTHTCACTHTNMLLYTPHTRTHTRAYTHIHTHAHAHRD